MNKNIMKEVAGLLNLELEEKFICKEAGSNEVYYGKLTEKGFMVSKEDKTPWTRSNWALRDLLVGAIKIIKLPWKPKKGEKYYTPSPDFDHAFCDYWDGYPSDFALKEVGMVFKSEKECEAALPELRKKYLESED